MVEKQSRKISIFLLGATGSGKSTVIDRVLERYTGSAGGFRTWFEDDRAGEGQALWLSDLKKTAPRHAGGFSDGHHQERTSSVFDEYASGLLQRAEACSLIVMDELDSFGTGCETFFKAVVHALDSDTNILGAVRENADAWYNFLSARDGVYFIRVTEASREALPGAVHAMLADC